MDNSLYAGCYLDVEFEEDQALSVAAPEIVALDAHYDDAPEVLYQCTGLQPLVEEEVVIEEEIIYLDD